MSAYFHPGVVPARHGVAGRRPRDQQRRDGEQQVRFDVLGERRAQERARDARHGRPPRRAEPDLLRLCVGEGADERGREDDRERRGDGLDRRAAE
jgi:hypothetical protein